MKERTKTEELIGKVTGAKARNMITMRKAATRQNERKRNGEPVGTLSQLQSELGSG